MMSARFPVSLRTLTWLLAFSLVGWTLSRLPLGDMLQVVGTLRVSQWCLWFVLNALILGLLTARWRMLTAAMALSCTLWQLFRVRQAGQFISFVTPGPQFGGEPLQVYWLWRRFGLPGHAAFLAVGLDRFFELWVNFAILLLAVLMLVTSLSVSSAIESTSVAAVNWITIAVLLAGLLLLMMGLGWLLWRQPQRLRHWIDRLARRWQDNPRLRDLDAHWSRLHGLLQEVVAKQRPALETALVLSLLAWAGMIFELWLLLEFVGVEIDLAGFVLLFTVLRLAFLLPLPGGIGSMEAALFWGFQALALPLPAAAGLILLMRLRDVTVLLIGAGALPGLNVIPGTRSDKDVDQ